MKLPDGVKINRKGSFTVVDWAEYVKHFKRMGYVRPRGLRSKGNE